MNPVVSRPFRVLILCAGNIGRSPLAAGLLRQALAARLGVPESGLAEAGVIVTSAGTSAPVGHGASARGMAFAATWGISLADHEAAQLTQELLDAADVVYGMDREQLAGVAALSHDALAKTLLWEGEGGEIPDPHYQDDEFFRAVGERIAAVLPDRVAEVASLIEARSAW